MVPEPSLSTRESSLLLRSEPKERLNEGRKAGGRPVEVNITGNRT